MKTIIGRIFTPKNPAVMKMTAVNTVSTTMKPHTQTTLVTTVTPTTIKASTSAGGPVYNTMPPKIGQGNCLNWTS